MKKYTSILFDLDDTIFDFTKGEDVALTIVCEKYSSSLIAEEIKKHIEK